MMASPLNRPACYGWQAVWQARSVVPAAGSCISNLFLENPKIMSSRSAGPCLARPVEGRKLPNNDFHTSLPETPTTASDTGSTDATNTVLMLATLYFGPSAYQTWIGTTC
jgi:hypothetical protein